MRSTTATDTFCLLYEPLGPSRQDTERTADHLAKFKELWERRCADR